MTAETTPPTRSGPLADLVALPATLLRFVVEAVRWVLVAPVQRERIRLDRRSAGVLAITAAAIALSTVMLVLVIAAPRIRAGSELAVTVSVDGTSSVPRAVVWLFVIAIALFITVLQTAALHTIAWFRIATLLTVALMLLSIGAFDTTGGMAPGVWAAVAGIVVLTGFQAVRWRRQPAWWEILVPLTVTVTVIVVVYTRSVDRAVAFGLDQIPIITDGIIRSFRLLSLPLAVFAGVAVAKVALSGTTLVSDFGAARFSPPTFAAIAAGVIGWRLVSTTLDWVHDWRADAGAVLSAFGQAALAIAVIGGLWWLAHHQLDQADRRARRATDDELPVARSATTVEGIVDRLDDVAIPAAVVITIGAVPVFIAALVRQTAFAIAGGDHWVVRAAAEVADFANQGTTIRWTRIIGGVGLTGAGLWLARRGRRGIAELTVVIGTVLTVTYVSATGALSGASILDPVVLDRIGVVVIAVTVVVWAVRHTISTDRLSAAMLLVLVSSLFAERDFVSSPITAIIGTSGIALVLFGFVWTFLADAGKTGVESRGFSRDSRLLLFCAQSLFGVTVLAWVAMTRDPSSGLELSSSGDLGDATIGLALLITVFLTIVAGATRQADFADTAVAADAVDLPFDDQIDAVEEALEDFADEVLDATSDADRG